MTDREFKMAYYKMLAELALKKAEEYELKGDKVKSEYFLALAEIAEKKAYAKKIASDNQFEKKP